MKLSAGPRRLQLRQGGLAPEIVNHYEAILLAFVTEPDFDSLLGQQLRKAFSPFKQDKGRLLE
jgi:hypothetical protein